MAFNVCTKEGKHLGITFGSSFQAGSFHIGGRNRRIVQIALTDHRVEDADLDYQKIKNVVAERHNAKSMLGKIKEEVLQQELNRLWEEEMAQGETDEEAFKNLYREFQPKDFDEKFIYRLFHLKNRFDLEPYWSGEPFDIKGFVLYDLNEGALYDGKTLLLEEPVKYIETTEEYKGIKPSHFVVTQRPEISIVGMGIGEGLLLGANISDFGGRNHTHSTKLTLLSGNTLYDTEVPIHIHAKKGMPLTMYVDQEKNIPVAFLCDEVLYTS